LFAGLIVLMSGGCATYQPVPADYVGPTATLADSAKSEDSTKAQMFVVLEIDGNAIKHSIGATAQSNYGRGFSVGTTVIERAVQARPLKLKLRATHVTGAPIHQLFSQAAGTFFSVEGIVDFVPVSGKRYVVAGELKR